MDLAPSGTGFLFCCPISLPIHSKSGSDAFSTDGLVRRFQGGVDRIEILLCRKRVFSFRSSKDGGLPSQVVHIFIEGLSPACRNHSICYCCRHDSLSCLSSLIWLALMRAPDIWLLSFQCPQYLRTDRVPVLCELPLKRLLVLLNILAVDEWLVRFLVDIVVLGLVMCWWWHLVQPVLDRPFSIQLMEELISGHVFEEGLVILLVKMQLLLISEIVVNGKALDQISFIKKSLLFLRVAILLFPPINIQNQLLISDSIHSKGIDSPGASAGSSFESLQIDLDRSLDLLLHCLTHARGSVRLRFLVVLMRDHLGLCPL